MAAKLMMRTTVVVVLATGLVVAAPASKPTHTPVTVTIADTQNGYPLRVGSDTQGAYVEIRRTTASSIERYAAGTDWILSTYSGVQQTPSNRTVFFDLREPASDNPAPPFSEANVQSYLIAHCRLVNVDLFQLASGASVNCPGVFRFQASGAWYRFAFNPENYPVDPLRLTCSSTAPRDAAGCKVWTVTPSATTVRLPDLNPKNRNRLLEIDESGEQILANLGDYYLSFFITIAR